MLTNNAMNGDMDADLKSILIDEEVKQIKEENIETKKDLAAMKAKVSELKQMWRAHLSRGAAASNTPSPKTLWKGVRGARPISPLVSTIINDLEIEEKKKTGAEPPVLRMDSLLRKKGI